MINSEIKNLYLFCSFRRPQKTRPFYGRYDYRVRSKLVVTLYLLLMPLSLLANDSEQLVKQFFGSDGIDDKKSFYVNEMFEYHLNEPTLGETLPLDMNIELKVLEKSELREIYSVLLTKDERSQDWYIYLVSDEGKWKISAVRNLALPVFFKMGLQMLDKKTNRTIEEESRYLNMSLMVKQDSELKKFHLNNIAFFEKILLKAKVDLAKASDLAKELNLSSVSAKPDLDGYDLKIGGILDNSVGYFYIPVDSLVPRMSDDKYIYIEEVSENWYLYKTT